MIGPGGEREGFHPAVRAWFETRFPEGPSLPQEHGWPAIAQGRAVSYTHLTLPTNREV